MVLTSIIIFSAFSLGCGFSHTLNQLIVCRAFQGIGGAGMYSLTMVVFPEISPPKVLPMISGIIGMVVAVSGVCGPILGGAITGSTTWRWIFWFK
jgi:MFS family permease